MSRTHSIVSCGAWVGLLAVSLVASRAHAQRVVVDLTDKQQTIVGFGAFGGHTASWEAGPYFDDAFVERIVTDLGATIMRLGVSPDFEPVNDNTDASKLDMTRLRFGEGTENAPQLALIRAVHARAQRNGQSPHKFIASVWTPPGWMKLDAKDQLAPFCRDARCGGRLNPKMREELAEYLVAYVRVFKQVTGADLYALSIQNELLFENAFDSCVYDAQSYAETLKVIGARLSKEKLRVKLFGPEHMGSYRWNDEAGLLRHVLDDADVNRYLDAYAVHSYVDGVSPDFGSADGWKALHERTSKAGKPLWMSETSRDEVTYEDGFDMARALHLALKHGRVSAWVYWTYANHLLVEREPAHLYYLLKQYFRYVQPGAVQVGSRADDASLLVTAFTEPDAITVVVINNSTIDKTASLRLDHGKAVGAWSATRTSRTEQSVSLGNIDAASISLPAQSITTLVSGAPGGEVEVIQQPSRDQPRAITQPTSGCRCSVIGGERPATAWPVLLLCALLLARLVRYRARRSISVRAPRSQL